MSTLVDTLITRFEAQDRSSPALRNITKAAHDAIKSLHNMQSAVRSGLKLDVGETLQSLMGAAGSVTTVVESLAQGFIKLSMSNPVAAIVAGTAALVGLGVAAMFSLEPIGFVAGALNQLTGTAITFASAVGAGLFLRFTKPLIEAVSVIDSVERSFSAMLQSGEKGRQMMEFVRDYGLKSAFNQEPLLEAVRALIGAGKDVNRFLPVLETLALFRGNQQENLSEVAAIARRLAGGQTAEALGPEGLGRFGINKKMLEMVGARFDKQGRFMGSTDDAFTMLERLAQSPQFKELKSLMEGSIGVQLSNAMDAVTLAFQKAGGAVIAYFLPPIQKASDFIRFLAESGVIEKLFGSVSKLLGGGAGNEMLFVEPLAFMVAVFEKLPVLVDIVKETIFDLFNGIKKILNPLITIFNFFRQLSGVKIAFDLLGGIDKDLDFKGIFDKGVARGKAAAGSIESRYEELQDKFKASKPKSDGAVAPEIPGLAKSNDALEDISENTRKMADYTRQMLDLRRSQLGGGSLAALGITPTELAAHKRSGSPMNDGRYLDLVGVIEARVLELLRVAIAR